MNSINVTRSSMPPLEEYVEEIRPLWESHWLTNRGDKHNQLEAALKDYLKADNLALFVNGHSALECIIETMKLGQDGRNEVITTPFTFASTTHAIVRKGLKPVFADINPNDYTMDPSKIEDLITDKTCAILPVHVYGNVCDVDAIQEIADKHDLKVIYDAAHAFGVEVDGIPVSSFGDASMLSFHATKVFNTIEGGAVCYSDPSLSGKLARWGNFGIADEEHVVCVGGNAKLNEFSAAMGLCNLRHVDDEVQKRKLATQRYWDRLSDVPGIHTFIPPAAIKPNYGYMTIVIDPATFGTDRDRIYDVLKENGIHARKYFYPLTSALDCYDYDPSQTPIALEISRNVLTLPLYADITENDIDRICDLIVGAR